MPDVTSPLGYDQALLRSYQERMLKKQRSSDAETIDQDVYADRTDPSDPYQPAGLVDRLSAEQDEPDVMKGPFAPARPKTPTTKGSIYGR